MKAVLLFVFLVLFVPGFTVAQEFRPGNSSAIYSSIEKMMNAGSYEKALLELKRNAGIMINRNDSLLYLKIKILENLYAKSNAYTMELDSSLQLFINRVNRYSFSDIKYGEIASIQSNFQYFKEQDKAFADSVHKVTVSENTEELAVLSNRLTTYIKVNPNSYYLNEISAKNSTVEKKLKKITDAKQNRDILKKVGKGNILTAGIILSGSEPAFAGLRNSADVQSFFSGKYSSSLGLKHSYSASLFGALFNIYTGSRVKASIVWNILDAEYSAFDWSKDTLLKTSENGGNIKEFVSVKGGTRVGPMVTVLLTRKIAVGAYYQARPGVQFVLNEKYFSTYTATATQEHTISPRYQNFNLSHEFGLRFYFFKRLFINPFIHVGEFNWQNNISPSVNDGSPLKANYKFNFTGLRIGI